MKDSPCRAPKIRSLAACVAVTLLSACSTPSPKQAALAPVRKVDYSAAPQLKAVAERARQTANQYYPSVCALLADGPSESPPQFDICFKKKLSGICAGEARVARGQIRLSIPFFELIKNDPAAQDQLVVHEMAHVAQHYYRPSPILGRLLVWNPHPPFAWEEGIANYVCFKLGLTNGIDCPQCGLLYPTLQSGYSCAGAFLMYLEGTYNSNIVRQLNTVLRQGWYSNEFFRQATGKELPALWDEFQDTPAFTSDAAVSADARLCQRPAPQRHQAPP